MLMENEVIYYWNDEEIKLSSCGETTAERKRNGKIIYCL